ncbi:MAG: chromate efflux transporter [Thermomicrobiales bacterium]
MSTKNSEQGPIPGGVGDVVRLAVKLGLTAFGGPAAHIAMLRQEVVDRRGWVSQQHFLDLIGITNLIPGPNSTEMVMHIGYERAGRRGLIAAGLGFIMPAALITLGFAIAYKRYGATPSGEDLLSGIKPVVLAVILQAIWRLGRTAVTSLWQVAFFAGIFALYVYGTSEILLLFAGALVYVLVTLAARATTNRSTFAVAPAWLVSVILQNADPAVPYSAMRLFLQFLKIGSILYGSGYVLIAFLRSTFVEDYGWLVEAQLLDAVAVGQLTPGPVFTTATFVGYLVGGFWGAIIATIAIFLPSFLFVALVNPLLPRLRGRETLSVMLDGITVAALALMAGVGWQLMRDGVIDMLSASLFLVSGVLLVVRNVNSALLILVGGTLGLLSGLI